MDIFTLFTNTNYTFLKLAPKVQGNTVASEYEAQGVFKLRDGTTNSDGMEQRTGNASLHIRPDETFVTELGGVLNGHGVAVDGISYRITGLAEGKDFDTGIVEFYLADLKRERLSEWGTSEAPLT